MEIPRAPSTILCLRGICPLPKALIGRRTVYPSQDPTWIIYNILPVQKSAQYWPETHYSIPIMRRSFFVTMNYLLDSQQVLYLVCVLIILLSSQAKWQYKLLYGLLKQLLWHRDLLWNISYSKYCMVLNSNDPSSIQLSNHKLDRSIPAYLSI